MVFAGTIDNGFHIIDLSRINFPKIIHTIKYDDSTTGVFLYSDDLIFISNGNGTINVIKLTQL